MQHFPSIHFQEFLEQLEMLVFAFHYASFLAILQSNMMNVFIPISLTSAHKSVWDYNI